jgi:protein TonB
VSVTFLAGAPPPPPPPPPPKKKKADTVIKKPVEIVQPRPSQIVQPKEKPPEPEEEEDDGEEGGVEGGVAGGVAGGVVGSEGNGNAPVMLAPNVGVGQRISDVNDPKYKPGLPPQLNRAGMSLWGLFKVCVSAQGKVTSVAVMKGADPLVDKDWMAKIKIWEYRPYSVNGRAVPFCSPIRLQVTAQN